MRPLKLSFAILQCLLTHRRHNLNQTRMILESGIPIQVSAEYVFDAGRECHYVHGLLVSGVGDSWLYCSSSSCGCRGRSSRSELLSSSPRLREQPTIVISHAFQADSIRVGRRFVHCSVRSVLAPDRRCTDRSASKARTERGSVEALTDLVCWLLIIMSATKRGFAEA